KDDKLEQIEWKRDWTQQGHNGTHAGYRTRKWARLGLAPHVIAAAPSPLKDAQPPSEPMTLMSLSNKPAKF
ncbi:MAG TPA: hypothetical protein VNT79_10050, partial [Phycisphaerae bacterium]|nr:hypothetical protein [Phycisphaerae bacterium]